MPAFGWKQPVKILFLVLNLREKEPVQPALFCYGF